MDRERDISTLGYSSTFHRKWQFYFGEWIKDRLNSKFKFILKLIPGLCSALFNYDHIDVIQFTLTK